MLSVVLEAAAPARIAARRKRKWDWSYDGTGQAWFLKLYDGFPSHSWSLWRAVHRAQVQERYHYH